MKFKEEDDEDGDTVETIETVSSSWVSSNRRKCYWPPKSIPMDRAGRMATQHVKPDPITWQNLDITFVNSYSKFCLFI